MYDYIGLCYFRLKQYPEAIASFQKLLNGQPDNALVHFRLAAAYEENQDYAQAEEQLREILKKDSKSVDAWEKLALLYDKQKDLAASEKAIADGLKAVPDHPDLLLIQAVLYHEEEKLPQAESIYQKVINIEREYKRKQAPEYSAGSLGQAYFNLGALLDKEGKFNDAIAQMKKVIEIEPQNADAYNYIGYSYADKGIQLDDALNYVQNAIKLDPSNSYYLDSLGWVYFKKEMYKDAEEQLGKALKNLKTQFKDDAVIYDHLAQVLVKLGQKDKAVAQWEKALKLDPENKDYSEKIDKNSSPDL